MYGINEHGVWFAKAVPTDDKITVSVVRPSGDRFQRIFDNDAEGDRLAMSWSQSTYRDGDAAFEVPLSAPEPEAVLV